MPSRNFTSDSAALKIGARTGWKIGARTGWKIGARTGW
jgi:hypothetical protein